MFTFFLFLSWGLFPLDSDWNITATELYQPIQPGEAIVSPNGDVLVLNFKQAVITRFNAQGEKANAIGFKGRGPGGLTYPMSFFLENDKIYVHDLIDNSINSFALDGRFIQKSSGPKSRTELVKVPGGWIYGNWESSRDGKPDPGVYWADENFENSREIFTLKSLGERGGLSMEMSDGKVKATYNPISTAPTMAYSQDLSRVYIAEPRGFHIHVLEGSTGKRLKTISRQSQPIPFDDAWGDKNLARLKEMMKKRGHNAKVQKNYPDHFPIVRGLQVLPDGTLVVNRWRGNPDENDWLIAFDQAGNEKKLDSEWQALQRVAGQHDHWWIVTTLNEDEAGFGRCKPTELAAFIRQHPIDFDGPIGRQIALED